MKKALIIINPRAGMQQANAVFVDMMSIFNRQGYMEADAYRRGYYVTETGAWDGKKAVSGWKQDKKGWWYGDTSGWYAKDETVWIDGKAYSFNSRGYWVQ